MGTQEKITSVLVIGSGPIVIGQAAEFDYSGTQALRVLKEEKIRSILINSNPATIMTDPEFADATYIEAITPEVVEKIIAKEKPDAILSTLGGQTALNTAMALHKNGTLEKYNIKLIGANIAAIEAGENRQKFKDIVEKCGAETCRSVVVHSMEEALEAAENLGYPVVVRPSFTMGGLGSGMAHNEADLHRIAGAGLHYSPTHELLLEESIMGWKEYELELMRDKNNNVIVVCTIENFDPVGVHTGDSITVAPAMTLTDQEYQQLRDIAIDIIREVNVEAGGCNIQFAVHPENGRIIVIEMNPRVSRSSALASKATGFPIAKIATKLALGYSLDEIHNDITQKTPAAFEPTLDYVVVKIPRFAFEKFPTAEPILTTTMKSVGEAMAFGRNFAQALQKAMRSLENKNSSFHFPTKKSKKKHISAAALPTTERIYHVQQALWAGATIEEMFHVTKIDRWFLHQIHLINEQAKKIKKLDDFTLREAKGYGFSDAQIAHILQISESKVYTAREVLNIHPVYKTVDTCAAEFEAFTPYHYSSYDQEDEIASHQPSYIILGSGPNRIGQGIEFDYSCVHASLALREKGYETVMINCNPETVSTDYDISTRLYFEPLTFEDVMEVVAAEERTGGVKGVFVQLGGQTPLKLAAQLKEAGVPIVGTEPEAINLAEDRGAFDQVLTNAGLIAPKNGTAISFDGAKKVADAIGYPVLVRPSYVLGGRGMEIVYDEKHLASYIKHATEIAIDKPALIDRFLEDAIEIDVDALYDGKELYIGGIMEHIEEAGIHSGDSSCVFPPITLSTAIQDHVRAATHKIAQGVGVRGLINIQFAVANNALYVLEANPRASRTVPFISKATGVQLAKAAAMISIGYTIKELRASMLFAEHDGASKEFNYVAVKEAVLPFNRFYTEEGRIVDSLLGPEMRSTGEVMGIDSYFDMAFAKGSTAGGKPLPLTGTVFVSVADKDKRAMVMPLRVLDELGFTIVATEGTAKILGKHGIKSTAVAKLASQDHKNTIVELMDEGKIDLVINTPSGGQTRADGYMIRTTAHSNGILVISTIAGLTAAVQAISAMRKHSWSVKSLQEFTGV